MFDTKTGIILIYHNDKHTITKYKITDLLKNRGDLYGYFKTAIPKK